MEKNYIFKHYSFSRFGIYFFFWVMIIVASFGVLWFQWKNLDIADTFLRYNSIRQNIGNWVRNITEAEVPFVTRNEAAIFETRNAISVWGCHDAGAYYIPLRLGDNKLPQTIRRGAGGSWKIKKNSGWDPAAFQFCKFIIRERSAETITCGTDSFDKTGNSGLFDPSHWCQNDWNSWVASKKV